MIKEKGTGEVYKSKKSMMAHERRETPAQERKEHGLKKSSPLPPAYKEAQKYKKGGVVAKKAAKKK